MVGALFLGRMSDTHGRIPVLIISFIGSIIGYSVRTALLTFAEGRYACVRPQRAMQHAEKENLKNVFMYTDGWDGYHRVIPAGIAIASGTCKADGGRCAGDCGRLHSHGGEICGDGTANGTDGCRVRGVPRGVRGCVREMEIWIYR